jgi:hypothetical protein
MSTRKTIDIEVTLENGDKVIRQFEDLGNGVKKLADSNEKLDATFDDVFNGMAPLTTRMGEAEDRLYELALAGDTTSKEYQELLTKVGQYRKVQIQTDLAVDSAATTLGQKLGGALTGATSGFAAVQGVMGLVGGESEQLEKALLKVQSALAIQQGVQGIREAIPAFTMFGKVILTKVVAAFSTLKSAIITTGIGALVVTLALVADAFDLFADKVDEAAEAQKRLAEENDRLSESFSRRQKFLTDLNDSFAKQRKFEIEQLKAQGASREEIYDKEVFDKKRQLENLIELEQEADAEFKRISKISGDEDFKQYDEALENASRFTKLRIEKERELKLFEINSLKERQQAYQDYADKRREIARQIEDLEIEIMDDAMNKELRQNQVKFDRLIEDTKRNTEINAKERKRLIELFLFQQQEAENEIRNRFRREELDAEKNQIESLQGVVEQGNQLALDSLRKQANKEIEISKKKNEKLEELEALSSDRKRDLAVGAATDTFTTIANLAELFAGESKKQQKKAFKVQKAANIAQATVDTFSSAIAAYKSQASIPVVGPVLGGIAAAAAVSAGLLNIKKISQQRFDSGGGTDGGGADFAPSGGGAQAPSFNVVGDSGVNQLAQLQQQPTQAFVVSGEVTTAQALDRNRVQNATL